MQDHNTDRRKRRRTKPEDAGTRPADAAALQVRISQLSPARKKLLRTMQDIHFGHIENLGVRRGEPVFDPPPRILREVRLTREARRREVEAKDFVLRAEVVELMLQLTALRDGIIESLSVQHGLPCSLVILESEVRRSVPGEDRPGDQER